MKTESPGLPVYLKASAEVKASDVCARRPSAVAVVDLARDIVRRHGSWPRHYSKLHEVISWKGRCEVHERFCHNKVRNYREITAWWCARIPNAHRKW